MKLSTLNFAIVSAVSCTLAASAQAGIVYDNLPVSLPGNVVSLGYEATSTSEFGDAVSLGGTDRALTTVKIVMSDWAKKSDYPLVGDATGYDHPLTVNLYNVGTGGAVGSLIGTLTQTVHVPWRPEADGPDGRYTSVVDGQRYNGLAFTSTFDFTSQSLTLPDSLIYSVAYNTADYGAAPIGAAGPYNSLNYGAEGATASVGTDLIADSAYLNSSWSGAYGDGGLTGSFRADGSSWNGYSPLAQISAVPEPTTLAGLAGASVLGLRRRRA